MLSREEIEDALMDNVEGNTLIIELTDGTKVNGRVLSYNMKTNNDGDSFEFQPNVDMPPFHLDVDRILSVQVLPTHPDGRLL